MGGGGGANLRIVVNCSVSSAILAVFSSMKEARFDGPTRSNKSGLKVSGIDSAAGSVKKLLDSGGSSRSDDSDFGEPFTDSVIGLGGLDGKRDVLSTLSRGSFR